MHGRTVKILAHICWYHYCIYILIMHGSWIVEKYGLCSLSSVYVFTSTASEVKCDFDPSYFVIADVKYSQTVELDFSYNDTYAIEELNNL